MDEVIDIDGRLLIPVHELSFRFSTSSGPGGQHVNKAATRVTLLFDVAQSPSLDERMRARLQQKLAHRLTKDGVLQIDVQESRSQHQNRETAVRRFQQLLAEALKTKKMRIQTRPSRTAIEKRIQAKKRQSQRKRERQGDWRKDT